MATFRFWVYINADYVKLSLKTGRSLSWRTYCRTDEGYSAEGYTWEAGETHVFRTYESDGRDCDGRLSQSQEDSCSLANLRRRPAYNYHLTYTDTRQHPPIFDEKGNHLHAPDWTERKTGPVFDEYAQRAGY